MNGSAERMPRLLALVPYLLARPGIPLVEAAQDFGVSPKQLRRDLELLWMCGLPGYGPGDLIDLSFEGETVTVTYDAGMNRPLRLTGSEATALLVALRALAETPGMYDSDAVHRTIVKLEIAAGQAQPSGVVVGGGGEENADITRTRELAQQALSTGRAMRIKYYTASRDQLTERTIDPIRLVIEQTFSYLEAWCRWAEDRRTFRLDRIDHLDILDEPAKPPVHLKNENSEVGVFPLHAGQLTADVVLEPDARWVAEYYPCEELAELGGGRLRIRIPYSDQSWILRLVLSLGGGAVLEHPVELAQQVTERATRALARTRYLHTTSQQ